MVWKEIRDKAEKRTEKDKNFKTSSRKSGAIGKRIEELDEEMGTHPSLDPDEDIDDHFNQQSRNRLRLEGYVLSHSGRTFTGKTFTALSLVKQNPKGIEEEVATWNLDSKIHEKVTEGMIQALKEGRYHTVEKLYAVGTEKSTLETLNSDDNVGFFDGWYDKIYTSELYIKEELEDLLQSGVDAVESVRQLNKIMILLEKRLIKEAKMTEEELKKNGVKKKGICFDSGTSILQWHNDVIRRKVMKIKRLAKEQGVPPQYWFWRNTKMESLALDFRNLNIPVFITWKMSKDREGSISLDQPKWHDDTSGHLSSIWINSHLVDNIMLTEIKKCRPRRALVGKYIPYPTANLILALCLGYWNDIEKRVYVSDDILNRFTFPDLEIVTE